MSVEEDKALVLRFLEQVWEQGELSVVDRIIAKEHVHHLTRRDIYGPDGVKQMDRPPSGKPVRYIGIDIFRVVQGKIVERWGIVDNASVLYQVGALT